MNRRTIQTGFLLCLLFCSPVIGQPIEPPVAVRALIQSADPGATAEYCGAVSTRRVDYHLFLLQQSALAGIVLVAQRMGEAPAIVAADTSLFPFSDDAGRAVEMPVQEAIELLLSRRNRARKRPAPERTSNPEREISAVGSEIDRVIYPICDFRLGSNSTHEILRILRTGPTMAVDPKAAPPGSIIVSPTRFSSSGPIYLGHAGIVGSDRSIYSADARYGGARTRNFSVTSWARQFSATNGSYAFVMHAPAAKAVSGL
jgi:hypothetical protein